MTFAFLSSGAAHACVCGEKPAVAQSVRESEAVFSGKVVSKLKYGVRFEVGRSWKGVSGRYIRIYTGNIRNDCDPSFRIGELWLIYAVKVPLYRSDNSTTPYAVKLVARGCGRSARLEEAADDLRELGEHERLKRPRKTIEKQQSSTRSRIGSVLRRRTQKSEEPNHDICARLNNDRCRVVTVRTLLAATYT